MRKTASKKPKKEVTGSAPAERSLLLAEFVRENMFAFVVREGMKALDMLLEQDREAICGPTYARARQEGAQRWDSSEGRLVMGGLRVSVPNLGCARTAGRSSCRAGQRSPTRTR